MNRDQQIKAFRLYLELADPDVGTAEFRAAFEADPDIAIGRMTAAGMWPDLLWSLLERALREVQDAVTRGQGWRELAADVLAGEQDAIAFASDLEVSRRETRDKLRHITGARNRGRTLRKERRRELVDKWTLEGLSLREIVQRMEEETGQPIDSTTVSRYRREASPEAKELAQAARAERRRVRRP